MDINDFSFSLGLLANVKPVSSFEWEIQTKCAYINNESIKIYIQKEGSSWFFSDNKSTLKYMNEMYDLKSIDVKHCISAVLKIYGFSITVGAVRANIPNQKDIERTFFNFIMCIGQLANMYAFFDKPE